MRRLSSALLALSLPTLLAACAAEMDKPRPVTANERPAATAGVRPLKESQLPEVLERVAFRSMKAQNYIAAASLYKRALEKEPNRRSAKIGLADALMMVGRGAQAVPFYQEALSADPGDAQTEAKLGRALLVADRPLDALVHIKESMAARQTVQGLNDIGIAYQLLGQGNRAKEYYVQALRQRPEQSHIQNNLAAAIALEGDYEGARQRFELIAGQRSAHVTARLNLAYLNRLVAGAPGRDGGLTLLTVLDDLRPMVVATLRPDIGRLASSKPPQDPRVAYAKRNAERMDLSRTAQQPPPSAPVVAETLTPTAPAPVEMRPAATSAPPPAPEPAPPITDLRTAAVATAVKAQSSTPPAGQYRVQLGAFRDRGNARAARARLLHAVPDLLSDIAVVAPRAGNGEGVYRLLTPGATDRASADSLCHRLKSRDLSCFVASTPNG